MIAPVTPMALSTLQSVVAVLGGLLLLATAAGAFYAVARSSAQDVRIKRLQDERDDYLSRLNYIEPKLTQAEQQNTLLRQLHNPTQQIADARQQEQSNHEQIVHILNEQTRTLHDAFTRAHSHLPPPPPAGS